MPSIKLGQLLSAANHFLGGSKGISAHPKQAAVDLLKKNPLELLKYVWHFNQLLTMKMVVL